MLLSAWWKDAIEGESVSLRSCHYLRRAHVNRAEVLIELDNDLSSFPLFYRICWTKPCVCSVTEAMVKGSTRGVLPTYDLDVR